MKVVMEYERKAGRAPTDVSKTGAGYDIRSTAPDGSVRYIEVKGHTSTGDVTFYYTEWQTAHRMRDEFFIYVVDRALTAPSLWIIQDPVGKGVEPTEKVVEYHVTLAQLQATAQAVAEPHGSRTVPCPNCKVCPGMCVGRTARGQRANRGSGARV